MRKTAASQVFPATIMQHVGFALPGLFIPPTLRISDLASQPIQKMPERCMSERWVPAVDHPLFSTASAGLVSATPGGQRFHTWTGAVSAPCRAWARYSERRMIETFSPAPASPAGTTYE